MCPTPTLYEELNLKPDCSSRDIRGAFIKLSKQHHPDANNSQNSHLKFVKINEAYNVLSKPETRRDYDFSLAMNEVPVYSESGSAGNNGQRVWRDEFIFRPGTADFRRAKSKPYYGIKGIKKVSNKWIVLACLIFAGVGAGVQALAIRQSFTFSREILDKQSADSYKAYLEVRERASTTNKEQQLERIKQSKSDM